MSYKTLKSDRLNDYIKKWLNTELFNFLKLLSLSGHKIQFTSKKRWNEEDDDKRKEFDFLETDQIDVRLIFKIKHPKKKGYYISILRDEHGDAIYKLFNVNEIGGYALYNRNHRTNSTSKEILQAIAQFKQVDFKKIAKTIETKGYVKTCLMKNGQGVASWNDILSCISVLYPVTMQGTKIDKDIAKTNSDIWFLMFGASHDRSKIVIVSNGSKYYFARIAEKDKVYVKRVLDKKLTDRDEKLVSLAIRLYVDKINTVEEEK
jgi:hypothetical protein